MSKKTTSSNINKQSLLKSITNTLGLFRKYSYIAYFLLVVLILGFTIFSIGKLANPEPTADQVDDIKLKIISPKIDATAIGIIEKLRQQNVNIESIFIDRNNPFSE